MAVMCVWLNWHSHASVTHIICFSQIPLCLLYRFVPQKFNCGTWTLPPRVQDILRRNVFQLFPHTLIRIKHLQTSVIALLWNYILSSSSLEKEKKISQAKPTQPKKIKIKMAEIITRAIQLYCTNLSLPFATFWLAITPKTNAKHPSLVVPSVLWQIGRPGLLIGMEGIADLLGQGWRNGWGRQWARQGAAEQSPPSPSSIHNGPRMPHASAVRCAVPCGPQGRHTSSLANAVLQPHIGTAWLFPI